MFEEPDEGWPVWDAATGEVLAVDARTYYTRWAKDRAAESGPFQVGLDELVDAGCDPAKIAWLLDGLRKQRGDALLRAPLTSLERTWGQSLTT